MNSTTQGGEIVKSLERLGKALVDWTLAISVAVLAWGWLHALRLPLETFEKNRLETTIADLATTVILAGVSFLLSRVIPTAAHKAWSRGWTCWCLVGSTVLILRIGVGDEWTAQTLTIIASFLPLLSVANTSLFALATLHLLRPAANNNRLVLRVAVPLFISTIVTSAVEVRVLGLRADSALDGVCSLAVALATGVALEKHFRNGTKRVRRLGRFVRIAGSLAIIGCFTLFGLVQTSISFQASSATGTGTLAGGRALWAASLALKVGVATTFWVVLILTEYWESTERHKLSLDRVAEGVVHVSSDMHIRYANWAMSEITGLSERDLLHQDVLSVLFESLFEAEDLFEELSQTGRTRTRLLKCKLFSSTLPNDYTVLLRAVRAERLDVLGSGYGPGLALYVASSGVERSDVKGN